MDVDAATTWATVAMVIATLLVLASALVTRRISCAFIASALLLVLLMAWLSPSTVAAWYSFVITQLWTLGLVIAWFALNAILAKR